LILRALDLSDFISFWPFFSFHLPSFYSTKANQLLLPANIVALRPLLSPASLFIIGHLFSFNRIAFNHQTPQNPRQHHSLSITNTLNYANLIKLKDRTFGISRSRNNISQEENSELNSRSFNGLWPIDQQSAHSRPNRGSPFPLGPCPGVWPTIARHIFPNKNIVKSRKGCNSSAKTINHIKRQKATRTTAANYPRATNSSRRRKCPQ
jgi:hypothetical protein